MFYIDEVEKIAGSQKNFDNGMKYFSSGKIKLTEKIIKKGDKTIISGRAFGSKVYNFIITLSPEGNIEKHTCTCPASKQYSFRACKHVIGGALEFFSLANNILSEDFEDDDTNPDIEEIFGILEDKGKDRKLLKVEYHLKSSISMDESYKLQIKVGDEKLFVIKTFFDFYRFVEGVQNKYKLSKDITLDLKDYVFDKKDITNFEHIDLLLNLLRSLSYYGNEENLKLNDQMTTQFFKKFRGEIYINGVLYETGSIEDSVLLIEEKDSYTYAKCDTLIEDGSILISNNKIIQLNNKESSALLLAAMIENESKEKRKEYKERLEKIVKKLKLPIAKRSEEKLKPQIILSGKRDKMELRLDMNNIKEENGIKYVLDYDDSSYKKLSKFAIEKSMKNLIKDGHHTINGVSKVSNFIYENEEKLKEIVDLKVISKDLPIIEKIEGKLLLDIYKKADKLELSIGIDTLDEKEQEILFERVVVGIDQVFLGDKIYKIDETQAKIISELRRLGIDRAKNDVSEFDLLKLTLTNPQVKTPIKEKLENLVNSNEKTPPKLEATLRDYQRKGYSWLKNRYDSKLGGILADDMGLGKTIQIIALLTSIYIEEKKEKPSLLIVPKSLLHNWKKEIEKFSPNLELKILEGTKKEREKILESDISSKIIITTYGTYRNDLEVFKNMDFEMVVLDEGQKIKNPKAKITKAVKEVRSNIRFILSGTPIENNLLDLWSLLDFTSPNYLGTQKSFTQNYMKKSYPTDDIDRMISLKKIVSPFMLRRIKKEVLKELPDKIETNLIIDLEKKQKKYYLSFFEKIKGEAKTIMGKDGFNSSRVKILSLLTRLRQICCSPELFIEDYKGGSAKIDTLLELLLELKESGHKVLVFSQFTKVFDVIEKRLVENNLSYLVLDGKTPSKERIEMCDEFNSGGKDIFLISLKAGGTGLNLTSADVVIHFDPWWNPAIENQATDRAHRIGQKSVVQVIKIIAENTIEEKVIEIQERKKKMIETMVDSKGSYGGITKEDLKELLEL
ncbi:DEAD/DEAH box helicase [Fusobacteria bacterium ZRK30]|nr:DEAD/DEAH box helicase [Fusobacteria bacterium ZRK30]